MSEGSWFEGTYVFDEAVYRDDFQREFATDAAESPGSRIIGSAPVSSSRSRSWRSPRAPRASAAARGPARPSA